MNEIKLLIDGKEVMAPAGTTILDAAAKAGIEIPRLCHQEGITPSGNCRICVVEVKGSRTLVGSCHTPIAAGMVADTRSQRVLEARRATVELLLTGHTGPCVIDSEARECALHKLASDLEAGPPRFHVKRPRFYATEEQSPYIRRDLSRCILCRKCIRACFEVAHQNVYSMAYRGFNSKVIVDLDIALNKEACRDCGICIEYCPTSALTWPEGVKKRDSTPGKMATKAEPLPKNGSREKLLGLLEERQRIDGFLSGQEMAEIADDLGITLSEVFGVATFYSFFSTKPRGKNIIRICKSLPCHMKDGPMVIKSVSRSIGIGPGETTADGKFSFELTNCIGACDEAPAMLVNDRVYGNLTPDKIADVLKSYREGR